MAAIVTSSKMVQVGIVVRNIEKTAAAYAKFFGVPVPGIHETDGLEKTHAVYQGKPLRARAKLAFFNMESLSLELIEPVGGPSTWKDHLDQKGEGVHHITFMVQDTIAQEQALAANGCATVQKGDYTGGRYSYVDTTKPLKVVLEFLQNIPSAA